MRPCKATLTELAAMGLLSICPGICAATDLTGLYIDLLTGNPPAASVVVTNPSGQRTGINLQLGSLNDDAVYFQEIPNSNAGYEGSPANDETGEAATTGRISIGIFSNVSSGTYHVTIYGIETRIYALDIGLRDFLGDDSPDIPEIPGVISAGEIQEFAFNYSAQPGSTTTVTKQVTFATLRTALQTWHHLSQLGDDKFVKSLTKMLGHAEKLAERCQRRGRERCPPAAAVLKHFIKRLEIANKKCDGPSAGKDCDEEREWSAFRKEHGKDDDLRDFFDDWDKDEWHRWKKTCKRFVSDQALAALHSDAQVLIERLSPERKHGKKDRR